MDSEEAKLPNASAQPMRIVADPNRRVPKYCTSVSFSKMKNGQIILTFIENDEALKTMDDQGVIIERILVDEDHAQQIVAALSGLLTKKE